MLILCWSDVICRHHIEFKGQGNGATLGHTCMCQWSEEWLFVSALFRLVWQLTFNKLLAAHLCYHVYMILHVKDPYLSVVRVEHCVLWTGFCVSLYRLHVLKWDVNDPNKQTNKEFKGVCFLVATCGSIGMLPLIVPKGCEGIIARMIIC